MNAYCKGCVLMLVLIMTGTSVAAENGGDKAAKSDEVWIDVYQGEQVFFGDMLDDLVKADVIYLGERHTIARHHELQEQIVADLGQKGIPLAIGLEQVEAFRQADLDRYNRGEIDFDGLAKAIDWSKSWGNYEQYRRVLEAARKLKAPVVALNAKAETIRQVARSGGVEKLPAEVRKELPAEMVLQDPAYEKLLSLELMVHASAMSKMLRPMIEAQMSRDESMAQRIVAFLNSDSGKDRKMIVICGGGHVSHGLGTPSRVRRRMPGVKDRIVLLSASGQLELSPAEKVMASNIEITHEQMRELNQPIADYLWIKPLKEEKTETPKSNPPIPESVEKAMLGEGNMGPHTEMMRSMQEKTLEYNSPPHLEKIPDLKLVPQDSPSTPDGR